MPSSGRYKATDAVVGDEVFLEERAHPDERECAHLTHRYATIVKVLDRRSDPTSVPSDSVRVRLDSGETKILWGGTSGDYVYRGRHTV